mgnify:FL=1
MIHKLFATPIYHENLNDESLRLALERKVKASQNDRYAHPNPPQGRFSGVFESKFDFLTEVSDPAIRQLSIQIDAHLNALIAVLTGSKPEEIDMKGLGCESWFHITTGGGYFQPHHHPNATWSVVYCVRNGLEDEADSQGGSGHLVFMDPRSASMFLDQHSRKLHRDISFDGVKYLLADGDIVIFPSYLQHYVSPYRGASSRITIAANFWGRHRDG